MKHLPNTSAKARLATRLLPLLLALLTGCSYSMPDINEPGIKGKVVDAETQAPIADVIVYGYYAAVEGSFAGGESVTKVVRSFETTTDANGVFELAPWNPGRTFLQGTPRDQWPRIGFFKGGYRVVGDSLTTFRRWYPQGPQTGDKVSKGNLDDLTARPQALTKAKNERERYDALRDANDSAMMTGSCGWEAYSKLLLEQHVEIIKMKRRLIPADRRKLDDMPKDAYPLGVNNRTSDVIAMEGMLVNPAPLHKLRDAYKAAGDNWKCRNPTSLLLEVESQLLGK
jgi:hypothetical protein